MNSARAFLGLLFLGGAGLLVFAQGTGCGDGSLELGVSGNVDDVVPAVVASAPSGPRPEGASWLRRVARFFLPRAAAQNGEGVDRLLARVSVPGAGGESPVVRHVRVTPGTRSFGLRIRLRDPEDQPLVSFCDDGNGNGRCDDGEPQAFLLNPIPAVCNGDQLILVDVDVDFPSGTAVAAAVEKDTNACGEPRPTATPDETPTATPEPSVTPTEDPDATPTPTPTPDPGATPTPTPDPDATPTPTPEPTATPCPPCPAGGDPCCGTCLLSLICLDL